MLAGFALMATGGMIAMAGMGIGGTAIVKVIRRWLDAQDEPPSAIMKRKVAQAKAAGAAGASAWQNGMTTSAHS
jgi:hypothetical protein